MTIPYRTRQSLLRLLDENGWKVVSNEYWDECDRIILEKDNYNFPLKTKAIYNYLEVVKLCESLGITPPEDCKRNYDQHKKYITPQFEDNQQAKESDEVEKEK